MSRRIGLISDTHGKLRAQVFELFTDVDLILHAGDIGSADIITELQTIARVHAVHGNTDDFDIRARFHESAEVEFAGLHIVVTHGHLLGVPTPGALRQAFPNADVIVYGHTHKPLLDPGRPLVVNPGAAGPARFNLEPSVAILDASSLEVEFLNL
ncbi:MAG: metallophosphoesterase family protein [Gemmatimonadota bacterium]